MTDSILQETYRILSYRHDTQECVGLCTLKRLLDKKLNGSQGDPSKFSFTESEVTSEVQERTVDELKPLTGHTRDTPHSEDGALVIVNYQGEDLLLDGNNRVNYWHAKGDMSKKLSVNYHSIMLDNKLNDKEPSGGAGSQSVH